MKLAHLSCTFDIGLLNQWYQPIVDLYTRDIIGYEALLRSDSYKKFTPADIFCEAKKIGVLNNLDFLLVKKVLKNTPADVSSLFINVFPSTLLIEGFISMVDEFLKKETPVVLEICENESIKDWAELKKVIDKIKTRNIKIAIDDFGEGSASFRQWIEFEPDFIKIDRYYSKNLSFDIRKQRIIKTLLMLFKGSTKIILEGIETQQDLQTAAEIGVRYGQGFLLGEVKPWNKIRLNENAINK